MGARINQISPVAAEKKTEKCSLKAGKCRKENVIYQAKV